MRGVPSTTSSLLRALLLAHSTIRTEYTSIILIGYELSVQIQHVGGKEGLSDQVQLLGLVCRD